MIYPSQIRAARGLLNISQTELSKRAGLGVATVKRIESSGDDLRVTVQTLLRIQGALEAAGVIFIDRDKEHGRWCSSARLMSLGQTYALLGAM